MSRITAFLSSTYSDLKEHRRAVAEALESLKITVECMERFTADPREPVDVCTDEISDCDVFIGIYAHRYGYVLPGTEESITERELQHARRENKPIFCFLVQDEYPWAPHFIDDGQNKTQLQKLKRAIDSRMVRGTFTSPDHLAREVTAAVSNYLTQGRYEPDGDEIRIERILNHDDPDLLAALGLMLKRIPEDERFDPEDVVRWLREDQVESSQRDSPRRHYFVVARTRSRVLGFTLLHCFPEEQLAFIAYLVGTKEIRLGRGDVSTRLYQSVVDLHHSDSPLKSCERFLFDLEDPRTASGAKERQRRAARLAMFGALAESLGFSARCLGIPYLQPHLHVPDREEIGSEPSMLLMIASRSPLSSLTREEAAGLLEFVYVRMYSKSFSDIPAEQAAYDAYLRELCQRQVELLPESVELLRPRDVHRVR